MVERDWTEWTMEEVTDALGFFRAPPVPSPLHHLPVAHFVTLLGLALPAALAGGWAWHGDGLPPVGLLVPGALAVLGGLAASAAVQVRRYRFRQRRLQAILDDAPEA